MRAECECVLRFYPALADRLQFSSNQPQPGFSGAGVVRVGGECGDFALRVWPRESLPLKRLQGLHRLLHFIHGAGVDQVSVPLAHTGGATIVEFKERFWQLEPWMPGTANFHDHPSPTRLKSAMKTLAEWHAAASLFKPDPQTQRWFGSSPASVSPACWERYQSLAEWIEHGLDQVSVRLNSGSLDPFCELAHKIVDDVRSIGPVVLGELREAGTWTVPLQPCLRDVWHDHILLTGDDVTGLIDPGACRRENVATDLARLLDSLIGDDTDQRQIAIDEYSCHRPLGISERKLVGVLDRSATVLSGLTWLRRRFLEQSRGNYQWDIILKRLETIASRLHHLASHPPQQNYILD